MSPKEKSLGAIKHGVKTGDYPDWVTGQDLAGITDYEGTTLLHEAAQNGHLPQNTTVQDLANAKDSVGVSALYIAVKYKPLPKFITIQDLKKYKHRNRPLIYTAAEKANLPKNTTVADLAEINPQVGYSPLWPAALFNNLPDDTTLWDLINNKNSIGESLINDSVRQPILKQCLKKTEADTPAQIKEIVTALAEFDECKVEAALWAAHQIKKLQTKEQQRQK